MKISMNTLPWFGRFEEVYMYSLNKALIWDLRRKRKKNDLFRYFDVWPSDKSNEVALKLKCILKLNYLFIHSSRESRV